MINQKTIDKKIAILNKYGYTKENPASFNKAMMFSFFGKKMIQTLVNLGYVKPLEEEPLYGLSYRAMNILYGVGLDPFTEHRGKPNERALVQKEIRDLILDGTINYGPKGPRKLGKKTYEEYCKWSNLEGGKVGLDADQSIPVVQGLNFRPRFEKSVNLLVKQIRSVDQHFQTDIHEWIGPAMEPLLQAVAEVLQNAPQKR